MLIKCCSQYANQFGKLCMATGLEKVNFHSNPKERQCQKMFKLLHNYTHFTCYQSNAQNSPSQSPTVCEPRTSRCSSWILKRLGITDQIANIHWIIEKAKEFQKNTYFSLFTMPKPLCGLQQTVEHSERDGNTRPSDLQPAS